MTSTTKLTFLTGKGRHRAWIARITGRDPQYGLAREFLKGNEFYDNGPRVTYDVPLTEGEIYEDWTGDFYVARNGALVEISRHDKAEVLALLDARAKAAEQPAAIDLEAYKGKVERFLRQEGYTTDPRLLIDRYPDTIAIGAAGVGPHDCALQLIDNWEHNVPAEGEAEPAQAVEQPAPATKPVVGPFDAQAREAGYVEPLLPITPLSVMYAVHGPDGVDNPKMGDLDWLRHLLRACQKPGVIGALDGHPEFDPDATLEMIRGVEDMYRRLATLTGGNLAIYDSEIRHEAPAHGYYIALSTKLAMNEVEAIWGIGRTADEAWGDAWGYLNCRLPVVEEVDGSWQIWNPINQSTEQFPTEEAAQAALKETGFRAEPCTEALYERVKAEGYDAHGRNSFNYVLNGRVYDVEEREAA
ncbi:MAG: hypothetical protein PGN33_21980 [Methylobacterium radiotolerans]